MRNRPTYIILIIIGVLAIYLASGRSTDFAIEAKPTLLPPAELKYFTLGFDEVIADGLWLRTIQDFDYCETKDEDSKKSVKCSQGWVYRMVEAIIRLAPDFRKPYYYGAMMLTVIVDDVTGASKIFDKAVAKFPKDYNILYGAAYQALIEEKNEAKASELMIRAAQAGGPPWMYALAGRLKQKLGQLELAKATLEDAVKEQPEGPGAERIQQRLDEVNAEIAKQQRESREQKH